MPILYSKGRQSFYKPIREFFKEKWRPSWMIIKKGRGKFGRKYQ